MEEEVVSNNQFYSNKALLILVCLIVVIVVLVIGSIIFFTFTGKKQTSQNPIPQNIQKIAKSLGIQNKEEIINFITDKDNSEKNLNELSDNKEELCELLTDGRFYGDKGYSNFPYSYFCYSLLAIYSNNINKCYLYKSSIDSNSSFGSNDIGPISGLFFFTGYQYGPDYLYKDKDDEKRVAQLYQDLKKKYKSPYERECVFYVDLCNKNEDTKKKCISDFQRMINYVYENEKLGRVRNPENENICVQESNESLKAICFHSLADKTLDISYCEKVAKRDYCRFMIAIKTGNDTLCTEFEEGESITSKGIMNPTADNCYYEIARNSGRIKLCLKIKSNQKKYCIWLTTKGMASNDSDVYPLRPGVYEKSDILICNEAKEDNSVIPKDCYYGIARNLGPSVCNELSGEDLAICLLEYAKREKNISICEMIPVNLIHSSHWTWMEQCKNEMQFII